MRVEIMHSVAKAYYLETNDSNFRERMTNGSHLFPFDTAKYDAMGKESCIVGMVMAWSVITLELFVNHSLAERLNNKNLAVMAIEYPRQITDKLKIAKSARSGLAKKLTILADSEKQNSPIMSLAEELSEARNLIIHDKPFELVDYGEGEVEIANFRSRGDALDRKQRYDDLTDFYKKCDEVKGYAVSISPVEVMGLKEISFSKLVNG